MASSEDPISPLWNDLPQELRDKIISHIPAPHLFSLRCVSKHWDSLISCPRFLRFCADNPLPNTWLLVPRWPSYSGLLAFLPDQNSWKTIPFGLPLSLHVESATRSSLLFRTPDYSFPQRLHVYSPLLRVSKQIIRCPSLVRGTAVLIEDQGTTDAFKILAVSGSPTAPSKELAFSDYASDLHAVWYDSTRGAWENGGWFPRDVIMGSSQKRSSVVVESEEGKMVLVFGERERSQELFVYETEKGRWGQVELPDGDLELRNWVVRCDGEDVYLVQLNQVKRKVWIWKVKVEELVRWIRRKGRKEEKVKWICEVGDFGIGDETGKTVDDCVGFGGRIVLCTVPSFVCFNVGRRQWEEKWIPPVEAQRNDCVSRAFVYCPTLV